ncbi:substrate-binding periplasmic protein [Pseudoduganella sp. UC29_106]|uniref:substrate-binding periplasmic protein n=1 Tax=Pseudoduganella sp. UC29_106 TaxID=3374553 RepID=UPI003757E013
MTLIACLLAARCALADTVLYPRPETVDDVRGGYTYQLLQLALAKAGSSRVLALTPHVMPQGRSIVEIAAGSGKLHVIATMTSREREEKLLPIRIPISKGLIGWRLFLVRADQTELFRNVTTLQELQSFRMAQGHDWPDLSILEHNGLRAAAVSNYSSLFEMLKAGRIDYLPRSAMEIWQEATRHKELAIEPYLLLYYPAPDYFFVNRADVELAEEIRRGLELAIADGSMDRLFYQHYGKLLRQSNLDKRRILELKNPELTPETPLERKELWFRLDDLRRAH